MRKLYRLQCGRGYLTSGSHEAALRRSDLAPGLYVYRLVATAGTSSMQLAHALLVQ